jgi:hypothetical protein
VQLNGGGSGAGASPTMLNVAAMGMDVLAHVGGIRFSNGVALKWQADAGSVYCPCASIPLILYDERRGGT